MLKKYYLSLIIILSTFFCCTKLDDFTINTQALNLTINSILVDSNTANFTIQINNPGKFNLVKQGFYYDTNDININTSPKIDITTNTLKLTALVYGKKYNVRSFIQAKGTNEPIYYGTDNTFYIPYKIPIIASTNVLNITKNTAAINFNFINYNNVKIDTAGIAYSNSINLPTIQNNILLLPNKGILTGNYAANLSNLTANTTYYVRVFFYYNGTIYYGSVQNFTTTNLPSTLTLANLDSNMVSVPAGSFTMGATNEQLANNGDGFTVNWSPTTQQVSLSSYKICRFEVTQQLWLDVMGSNPSFFNGGSYGTNLQRPIENVSWDNCQTFIAKLKQLTNKNYRLPTEAEWEYAARGGANTTYNFIYSGSNTLNDIAWNSNNSNSQTQTIGTKQANALGLYDMSGNIWEWCNDWYGNYSSTAVTNPQGPSTGAERVLRGGGWDRNGFFFRVSIRYIVNPSNRSGTHGLRLVLDSTILPTITTNAVTSITNTTATANINISNPNGLNITATGVAYSSSNSTPTTTDAYIAHSSTGNLAGNYTLGLSSLTANTRYYVRAYINYNGTIYYGNVQNFTTLQTAPTITTNAVTSITNTTATANINISNPNGLNITVAGVAYSSSNSTPTTADAYIAHNSTGNLAGNYTLGLSSLTANTSYYVRGYINYNGTIYYGNVQNFTTTNLPTTLNLANLETNMVSVPAGSFTMGATSEQLANNGDGFSVFWSPTTQQVSLSTYKICRFEVTQQLWLDVMGSNPSSFTGNLQRPVETVSWDNCQTFIAKLKQLTNKNYRLPTEAEWEYAARGGANSTYSYIYSGSNTLNDVAWYASNSSDQTHTIGTKQANALGLYDMSGNVWELCNDWYGDYSNTGVTNPQGPATGSDRVLRGSCWGNSGSINRVSYRHHIAPSYPHFHVGLRLVLDNTTIPTISTNAVTSITNTAATANINISNPNGLNITAAGVAYSSSNSTPTTADAYIAHNSTGNLSGNYTLGLSSLTANTTYYVRGYINFNGTIYYGAVQNFTTTNVLPTTLTLANLETNMVTVPAGSFTMGATSEQLVNNGDFFSVFWSPTTQQVTLSTYKICRFEVTQQLWQDVMGSNPSYFTGNLQRPVEQVRWSDCQTFINRLNQLTGKTYRLPTEAEWEYAARGGANSTYSYIYSGGNTLNDVAWNGYISNSQTQTVGTKQANDLGLYDMSGNVWEWCNDWYGNYSNTAVTNPQGAATGSFRVIRGGSWGNGGGNARVSSRYNNYPSGNDDQIGIRLVFSSN